MQAQFICLAHNLMRLLEDKLANEGIGNATEIKRRAGRSGPPPGDGVDSSTPPWPDCLREWLQRFTQRGVKFIRWLRAQLLVPCPWHEACASRFMTPCTRPRDHKPPLRHAVRWLRIPGITKTFFRMLFSAVSTTSSADIQ
jgi:hypothetical protein